MKLNRLTWWLTVLYLITNIKGFLLCRFKRGLAVLISLCLRLSAAKNCWSLCKSLQCTFWPTQLNIWTEQRSMGSPLSLGLAKCLHLFGFKCSRWWNVSWSETALAFFQVQFRQLCKGFAQVQMNSNTGVKEKGEWNKCSTVVFPCLAVSLSVCWFQCLLMQHLSYDSPQNTTLL